MAFILASYIETHTQDENGNRVPHAVTDVNGIVGEIKRLVPGNGNKGKFVFIANDPYNYEDNDAKSQTVFHAFELTGFRFEQTILLDARNQANVEGIVSAADLIILGGGKCVCQNEFFKRIRLDSLLRSHKGLIIGISAGAMNLCKTVANFPEEIADLADPRWLEGLGFFDGIVIPHFDCDAVKYQFDCGEIDIVGEYILPMSRERDFWGVPNGAYIIIENDGTVLPVGDIRTISGGAVVPLKPTCENM